jgi:hypothetical protein
MSERHYVFVCLSAESTTITTPPGWPQLSSYILNYKGLNHWRSQVIVKQVCTSAVRIPVWTNSNLKMDKEIFPFFILFWLFWDIDPWNGKDCSPLWLLCKAIGQPFLIVAGIKVDEAEGSLVVSKINPTLDDILLCHWINWCKALRPNPPPPKNPTKKHKITK